MNVDNLAQEVRFGLENLSRIHSRILRFDSQTADSALRLSALTYECSGYYNAIEHMILRFVKHLGLERPSGAFSHRDTLRTFDSFITDMELQVSQETMGFIVELMAFRHVATKIYGFLIDESKLEVIVSRIQAEHTAISALFEYTLSKLTDRENE